MTQRFMVSQVGICRINYSISVTGKARLLSAKRGVSRFGHGRKEEKLVCSGEGLLEKCPRNGGQYQELYLIPES